MLRPRTIAMVVTSAACSGCGPSDSAHTGAGSGGEAGTGIVAKCADGWCLVPPTPFLMGSPEGEVGAAAFAEDQVEVTLTRPFFCSKPS